MSVSQVPYVISKDHSWSITRGMPKRHSDRDVVKAEREFLTFLTMTLYVPSHGR
jgi:hypothetical protein